MPIEWNEFTQMLSSAKEDLQRLRNLAQAKNPADRVEYEDLCQRVFDTTSKMLESTANYLPDISTPALRDKWIEMKNEANSIRSWVHGNKGRSWPNN